MDRFHTPLKRFIWFREHLNPTFSTPPYKKYCDTTGYFDVYPQMSPQPYTDSKGVIHQPRFPFISIWLYIIHDNWIHLFINYMAIKYLT